MKKEDITRLEIFDEGMHAWGYHQLKPSTALCTCTIWPCSQQPAGATNRGRSRQH